jgi:hypothetical protein
VCDTCFDAIEKKNERDRNMQPHKFDDRNITWRTIDWLEHVAFHVYSVDEENRIVDVI